MKAEQFQLHAAVEETHWWFTGRRHILRRIVETLLPPGKERHVLDVGCGTGANIAALADSYTCTGVDESQAAIELARQRFPGVEFLVGSVPRDVSRSMLEADVVLLMDVLEHVNDDFELLSALLAALKPGAHLVLTVPADQTLWSQHDQNYGHFRRYDPARLRQTWAELPVSCRLLSHFNSRMYPVVRMIRTVNRWVGRTSGRDGTDLHASFKPLQIALRTIFAGEAHSLVDSLDAHETSAYRKGVSLMAILRREAGPLEIRNKPEDIVPDLFNPETGAFAEQLPVGAT